MAELTTEHTFKGTVDQVYAAIRLYPRYPEFIPGVTQTEVMPPKHPGSTCQVRYDLKIIKSFYYILDMYEESPGRLWWKLDSSNIMKHSNGSWTLKPAAAPGHTKATYSVDVGFSGLVPGRIVDQITKANLPAMMKGFQQLIDACGAKT